MWCALKFDLKLYLLIRALAEILIWKSFSIFQSLQPMCFKNWIQFLNEIVGLQIPNTLSAIFSCLHIARFSVSPAPLFLFLFRLNSFRRHLFPFQFEKNGFKNDRIKNNKAHFLPKFYILFWYRIILREITRC